MDELARQKCLPRAGVEHQLSTEIVAQHLEQLPGWRLGADLGSLEKRYAFLDFYRTMAFVNAVAWIAHEQDHHPDLSVGYNYCLVRLSTHDVGGLSWNDLICAARIDALSE